MHTLITGGAGFIGSHLAEYLISQGDDVTVLDNLSTGRLANLRQLSRDPRLGFVEGDVRDTELVESLVAQDDRVFHLAAAVGVHVILDDPLGSLRTNLHGTENVLASANRHETRVLLASTSEIYGKNTADRLHENSDRILGSPLLSRWTYAAAKGIDEAFAHAYWRKHDLQVSIVRLFNTVGPRQTGRYGMVVPRLVRQALNDEPLTVYGDGEQTRCFSYVGDVVPALVAVEEHPDSAGRAFNLGGAQEISIKALAEQIIDVTGSRSIIEHIPYDQAYGEGYEDMRRRVPDNTAANELVGFVPKTSVRRIIELVAQAMLRDQTDRAGGLGSTPEGAGATAEVTHRTLAAEGSAS